MMKLVGHPITWLFDRYTDQLAISRLLAKVEVDFWCILMLKIKNTRDGYRDRDHFVLQNLKAWKITWYIYMTTNPWLLKNG